jgi:hypothetical protein
MVSLPPLIRRTHGLYFREVIPSVSQLRSLDTLTLERLAVWEGLDFLSNYGDRRQLITWLASLPARRPSTSAPSDKP